MEMGAKVPPSPSLRSDRMLKGVEEEEEALDPFLSPLLSHLITPLASVPDTDTLRARVLTQCLSLPV